LLDSFSKNNHISNFIKIRPVEAQLFHADRRTDGRPDMTKLRVAFRNFANVLSTLLYNPNSLHISSLIYVINNIWKSSRTNKSFRGCLRTTILIYTRVLAVILHAFFTTMNNLSQGCTNSKRQVCRETTVAPKICWSPVWNLFNVTLSGLRILRWLLNFWKTVVPYMLSLTVVVDSGKVDTSCQERYPTQKDAIYAVVVVKIDCDVGRRLPSVAVRGSTQHYRLLWCGTGNNTKKK
jgi:hypothetical protein